MARSYKTPRFPETPTGLFLLIDEAGVEDGPYRVSDFAKNNDDNEWAAQTDGRPLFLRITKQRGDVIWTLDGGGHLHRFVMRALGEANLA